MEMMERKKNPTKLPFADNELQLHYMQHTERAMVEDKISTRTVNALKCFVDFEVQNIFPMIISFASRFSRIPRIKKADTTQEPATIKNRVDIAKDQNLIISLPA